eukprot:CAMPEP_0185039296 /NCGR_PEP_ID=MMETSP1103-20130426/36005_1 /TAXON_ID=36769 /ORGANISM="Paraphysomonas bandaiensis, Strain Caron Lab Isolate" /LENGTH=1209 /DNA_ID=CAMNT_0027578127 /DNA_START=65 /DNA_END=3694 /DNA_ORIENTATION=-
MVNSTSGVTKPSGIASTTSDIERDVSELSEQAFIFLTEPNSSAWAFRWSLLMSCCVILNAIFLVLETVDGRNHYHDREDMSTYKGLPDENTYIRIQIIFWVPMCFDALCRIIMTIGVFLTNDDIADDYANDVFKCVLFVFDVCSTIPFVIRAVYLYPAEKDLSQFPRLLLRCLDLLSSGKILRASKDILPLRAIRIALSRSMVHLVLPLFFFLVFNIFFGVVVYFMEPCYNFDTCAWENLFDACFFSVVTMTTTGYGNQVPSFLPSRVVSVVIMLFGSLFMSMPLAIIGNEYSSAWESLTEERNAEIIEKAADGVQESEGRFLQGEKGKTAVGGVSAPEGRKASEWGTTTSPDINNLMDHAMLSPLMECRRNVEKSLSELQVMLRSAQKMTPAMLLTVCELRGWIAPLVYNINTAVTALSDGEVAKEQRKISVFRNSSSAPDHATGGRDPKHEFMRVLAPVGEEGDDVSDGCVTSGSQTQQQGAGDVEVRTSVFSRIIHGHPLRSSFWPFSSGSPSKSKVARTVAPVCEEEDSNSFVSKDTDAGCPDTDVVKEYDEDVDEERGSSKSEDELRPGARAQIGAHEEKKGVEMKRRPQPKHNPDFNRRELTVPNQQAMRTRLGMREVSRALRGISKLSSGEMTLTMTRKLLKPGNKSRGTTSFIVKMAKAAPDIANMRGDGEDFARNMERAVLNPKSLRTRVWMILEFPHSSKGARVLQFFFLSLILLSVLMLYTQTLPTFSKYGEDSELCGKVLRVYCMNKDDTALDAGCFVHNSSGVTNQKLRFGCSDRDCFGHGVNFGARYTNVSCANKDNLPFETSDELTHNFRAPDFIVSRDKMHQIQAVCTRIECKYDSSQIVNGNLGWVPLEIFVNLCFTVEIVLRMLVSNSMYGFFVDFLNVFDILSVVPFYIDVITAMRETGFNLDFAILASSPEPILLVTLKSMKVFRLFKMTRHFSASQVLVATANKAWRQIVGILSLLFFIVIVFALLLYEVEKGTACYVGDSNCDVPDDITGTVKNGQRILINKLGEETKFSNVLDALWFSIVTLTSVGYGEIVPVTNIGQVMSIFLMLFGAFYLAMPLTVAANTFWDVHQLYLEKQLKKKRNASKKIVDAMFVKRMKSLETALTTVVKKLESFFYDIQQPSDMVENKASFLERCMEIESSLSNTLQTHGPDLRRLSVAYSSHVSAINHRGSTSSNPRRSIEDVGQYNS